LTATADLGLSFIVDLCFGIGLSIGLASRSDQTFGMLLRSGKQISWICGDRKVWDAINREARNSSWHTINRKARDTSRNSWGLNGKATSRSDQTFGMLLRSGQQISWICWNRKIWNTADREARYSGWHTINRKARDTSRNSGGFNRKTTSSSSQTVGLLLGKAERISWVLTGWQGGETVCGSVRNLSGW